MKSRLLWQIHCRFETHPYNYSPPRAIADARHAGVSRDPSRRRGCVPHTWDYISSAASLQGGNRLSPSGIPPGSCKESRERPPRSRPQPSREALAQGPLGCAAQSIRPRRASPRHIHPTPRGTQNRRQAIATTWEGAAASHQFSLICTSTPAARSSFIKASTVLSVGSTISMIRLWVRISY